MIEKQCVFWKLGSFSRMSRKKIASSFICVAGDIVETACTILFSRAYLYEILTSHITNIVLKNFQ